MGLRAITLKDSYRTGRDDLLSEFYIPVLSQAVRYDRAVGFFSSSILSHAAQGVSAFFGANKGQMRLIFGGELSPSDYAAALRGNDRKALSDFLDTQIDDAIRRIIADIDRRRLELFAFLVAVGRLSIKFAVRASGMFHDKFGILYDDEGNVVAFDGSANESAQAFLIYGNWERVRTYKAWSPGQESTVRELETDFAGLWNGGNSDCITLDFPEAAKRRLSI